MDEVLQVGIAAVAPVDHVVPVNPQMSAEASLIQLTAAMRSLSSLSWVQCPENAVAPVWSW